MRDTVHRVHKYDIGALNEYKDTEVCVSDRKNTDRKTFHETGVTDRNLALEESITKQLVITPR